MNLIQHPNKLYPIFHIDGHQIGQQNFNVYIGAMYLLMRTPVINAQLYSLVFFFMLHLYKMILILT